jgi:hypothetical protein
VDKVSVGLGQGVLKRYDGLAMVTRRRRIQLFVPAAFAYEMQGGPRRSLDLQTCRNRETKGMQRGLPKRKYYIARCYHMPGVSANIELRKTSPTWSYF